MADITFKTYLLRFTSPLHIGDSRDDYGISKQSIASDSFYSSLFSMLAQMKAELPSNGDMGCSVSSLFPYYQKRVGQPVLFFPKPMCPIFLSEQHLSHAKEVKKVEWIDEQYFKRILCGNSIFAGDDDFRNINDKYLTSESIDGDFVTSSVAQRVNLQCRDNDGKPMPFYMDKVLFKEESGLYFVAHGDTTLLDQALRLLQVSGIGTDRNVGNGFFEIMQHDNISFEVSEDAIAAVSLSTFIPESKDQLDAMLGIDNAAYSLERRGGWITTPPNNTIRKNAIYAFSAGSVFARPSGITAGAIVDLRPDVPMVQHPIWRCGRAIFLPIKGQ